MDKRTVNKVAEAHYELYGDEGKALYLEHVRLCGLLGLEPVQSVTPISEAAMSAYNRAAGWYSAEDSQIVILKRHFKTQAEMTAVVAHETCHHVQHHLEQDGIAKGSRSRGTHRCESWYMAVSRVNEALYGKPIPKEKWAGKTSRMVNGVKVNCEKEGALSEVQFTHYPTDPVWKKWR